ncbi:hypothetical protein ACET9H_16935 [Aeromonas media]|uniref:hypothetical protein n=1 Tax=Aeromonas media TaxID=651 RepID=UPI0038D0C3CB
MNILERNTDLESLLPMALIQDHIYSNDPDQLPLLEAYRLGAFDSGEKYLNRAIPRCKCEIYTEKQTLVLPYGGYAVVSVTDIDGNGLKFDFNRVTKRLSINAQCPAYVVFNAGYDVLPGGLQLALLMAVATAYENRESISNGVSVAEIPISHRKILDLYRLCGGD